MTKRRQGLALLCLAVLVVLFGGTIHLTEAARSVVAVILGLFGAALIARTGGLKLPAPRLSGPWFPSPPPPLEPGERYDTTVKLATLPNTPLADLWCQRLREQGIEAFCKSGPSSALGGIYGGAAANPGFPTEVWVGEHDAERARDLFPELA